MFGRGLPATATLRYPVDAHVKCIWRRVRGPMSLMLGGYIPGDSSASGDTLLLFLV